MMYKLIAIDLDGTLLDSQKQISAKNMEAVRLAQNLGVMVVVCSGRILAGARVFASQMGLRGLIVACNGALIKDLSTEEVLYSSRLSREDCIRVGDICRRENIYFHAYVGDVLYTERLERSSLFYYNKNKELSPQERIDIRVVENMTDIFRMEKKDPYKMVVISESRELLKNVRDQVEEIDSVEVTSSLYNNFEVLNRGVSKGRAIELIARTYGIHRNEIISIGDNENDISMLEYAGVGVVMGNAEKEIKKMADFITGTNDESGVAQAILKFIA